MRSSIDDDVELVELDTDINDESFAEVLAETLDGYMRAAGVGPGE